MSEHVLGTGQKQTLRNILRLTEALVVRPGRTQGA